MLGGYSRRMTKPTHGGARPNSGGVREGAGRKPTAIAARNVKRGPVLLTATEAATLDERAASRSLSVQEAIRTALRVDGLID